MQCVAQATPMIAVGFTVMRRGAVKATVTAKLTKLRSQRERTDPTPARSAALAQVDASPAGVALPLPG